MIRLSQEFGAHAGRQLAFDQERVRLGRAPTNDVAFDAHADLDSSGAHCEILREQGAYVLVDLGSRNGTLVNGARIQRQALRSGDVIECGRGGPRLRVEIAGHVVATAANGSGFAGAVAGGPSAQSPVHGAPGPQPMPFSNPGYAATPPPAGFAGAPPNSVGAAVAARMAPGAQIGKRTVAMMIDAAMAQAGPRRSSTGLKVALGLALVVAVVGIATTVVVLNDEREAAAGDGDGSPGERISAGFEGAIYMLAIQRAGAPPQGFCTGFAVSSSLLATNAHCVEVAQQAIQRGSSIVALRNNGRGAQCAIVPVYRDPRFHNTSVGREGSGFDVGLMRSASALPVAVRLATLEDAQRVRSGAQIYVYGFPGLTMNEVSPVATITEGVINRTTDFFDRAADPPGAQKVQHTAQTTSGSSGSPIFLANGTVIGINAGSLADEERQSMLDPRSGQRVSVEVNRSSNFKYGMRSDLIRQAIQSVGESAP